MQRAAEKKMFLSDPLGERVYDFVCFWQTIQIEIQHNS